MESRKRGLVVPLFIVLCFIPHTTASQLDVANSNRGEMPTVVGMASSSLSKSCSSQPPLNSSSISGEASAAKQNVVLERGLENERHLCQQPTHAGDS